MDRLDRLARLLPVDWRTHAALVAALAGFGVHWEFLPAAPPRRADRSCRASSIS